jgi:hypothetical protein
MPSILRNPTTTHIMNSLQSNPVRKLLFINMATMVVPRISIAASRNKYAGQETALYEFIGLFTNFALPGLVALGVANFLDKARKNPLGLRTTGWAKPAYVDSFAEFYKKSVNTVYGQASRPDLRRETLAHFVRSVLGHLEVPDPVQAKSNKLTEKQLEQFTEDVLKLMNLPKAEAKAALQSTAQKLANALGSYDRLILKGGKDTVTQSNTLIQHLSFLGKEFQKSHTSELPAQIVGNLENIVKRMHQSILVKSAVSMTAWIGLACSLQFINRWITKLRTGQTGFVGYTDFNQQPAGGKKPPKILSNPPQQPLMASSSPLASPPPVPQPAGQPTAPALASPVARIGMQNTLPSQQVSFSGWLPNVKSSQFLPTVEQLKVVYPLGALGRLLASRDLSEARETLILSGFGTLNFLFIPNLVENLVARGFKNPKIFSNVPDFGQKQPKNMAEKLNQEFLRLNQSSIRSYQDIEAYSKKMGEQLAHQSDEVIHKHLSGILREADPELKKLGGLSAEAKAQQIAALVAKELNGIKNISSIAGITYSCLTLGVGLNLLNVYITNKKRARQLAREAQAQASMQNVHPPAPAGGASVASSSTDTFKNPFQAFSA